MELIHLFIFFEYIFLFCWNFDIVREKRLNLFQNANFLKNLKLVMIQILFIFLFLIVYIFKTIYLSKMILKISINKKIICFLILITFTNGKVSLINIFSLLLQNIGIRLHKTILIFLLWSCVIGKESICCHLIAPSTHLTFYFLLRFIIIYFLKRALCKISFRSDLFLIFKTFHILHVLYLF